MKDTQAFPARLRYPRHCGALCRAVPSEGCLLAADRTRALLRALSISLGAAAKIPQRGVVLAFEPRRKEGAAVPAWVLLATASRRAGNVEPHENFIEMDALRGRAPSPLRDGVPCGPMALRLAREAFARPASSLLRAPLGVFFGPAGKARSA